jgi:hypothetical protein
MKLPIDYVVRNGQVYYLDTRSIATLTEAGIPKSDGFLIIKLALNYSRII